MDPLSDVLRAVRLSGAYFYLVEATHPWSVASAPARELAPRILPDAEHLISYHIVTSGSCWGGLVGERQVLLQPGDAILFPHGDAHFMSSVEGEHVGSGAAGTSPERYRGTVHLGGRGGPRATFVCGFLGCDARPYNPLLAALPRFLHLSASAGENDWLSAFPRVVVNESGGGDAGGDALLTRMAELMFVEVVRRYLATLPPQQAGWLAGLRDPVVSRALGRLHERPAHPWTLAELAREGGASRTVLVERFARLVGMPPMQYLAQWRLQLAAEQLVRGSAKVAAVGAGVGYESEAAFSRAFKRATGYAPAAWRRARRGA